VQAAAVTGTHKRGGHADSETIEIAAIRADQRAQPRENLSTSATEAYAEDMAAGASFPPLVVFYDGSTYWLADGFHRRYAAVSLGLVEFQCDVRAGGLRDAILFSCQVNSAHGVPRTNEDKRRAVTKLLLDEEWSKWSDHEIARRCAVGNDLVRIVRKEVVTSGNASEKRTYKTKHGTAAKMKTAAIGPDSTAAKAAPTEPTAPQGIAESTPNSRFLNVAWDAEHRPSEFNFPSMKNFGALAAAADRVSKSWSAAAAELRRLGRQ
jgi:hypothetical protein